MMSKDDVKPMRLLSPKMIRGLRELCHDINRSNSTQWFMVEVGCYIGESTAIFLRELSYGMTYCIDPWIANEKYTEKDIARAYEIFNSQFVNNKQIKIIRDYSTNVNLNIGRAVDFVYIDASHKYEDVLADIRWWKQNIQKGGFIGGHDYENLGKFGVKKAVDEIFGEGNAKIYEDTSWLIRLT